jgi:hypothetical protein
MRQRVGIECALVALLAVVSGSGAILAQATTEKMTVSPIECWWRTGASAVHVGEPFTVVLTCAVLDTVSTTVVPDQSRLDPAVLQLPPFEVMGGTKAPDLKTTSRRFFQYEYNLRYIGEEFGRDVSLPSLQVAYRVQNRTGITSAAIETRDKPYVMPAQPIRIVTLVPTLAADIRERAPDSFADINSRRFRANLLDLISTVLFALGGVLAAWALIRALQHKRSNAAQTIGHVSDAAILREVARELKLVEREKQGAWTSELGTRLLQALRVAAAFEVAGHAAQTPWTGRSRIEGQLLVRGLLRPDRAAVVTGSATCGALAQEMRKREARDGHVSGAIVELYSALLALESSLYGREMPPQFDMDDALMSGQQAVRQLRRSHGLLALWLASLGQSVQGLRTRLWAR